MSRPRDYTTWQHAELIERVQELERQLQRTTQELTDYTEKQAARKPPRPFDASKHSNRKIALKFAYLGANYNGLEHHTGNVTSLPPVEKVLWQALVKTRLITPQYKEGQIEGEVNWDGSEYSKCGRTDKGVSSFGQVIGIRVRSARPLQRLKKLEPELGDEQPVDGTVSIADEVMEKPFDSVRDELPYTFMLNKVLPPDIRVLAWCPDPTNDFDARFSCRERRYRYFFTVPAFLPIPGMDDQQERWLNIDAMQMAAKKYEGLHDFRNFCKIDGAKQITNFNRRIFRSAIHAVEDSNDDSAGSDLQVKSAIASPKLYYYEVRGSAFLWHQVRHLVAILFLVGQGLEQPSIVDQLLDVQRTPARPAYQMASDAPLVLWDCIFPDLQGKDFRDHSEDPSVEINGYNDSLGWVYENDTSPARGSTLTTYNNDQRYDREGVLESLWSQWRHFKLSEILARQLMLRVANGTRVERNTYNQLELDASKRGARVFEGGNDLRSVGPYTPMLLRNQFAEPPNVVNARYAAKKGLRKHDLSKDSAT